MLGDMLKQSGTIYLNGNVAFCSQQAWIQNATVRDNILFGKEFDREKYQKSLKICELRKDMEILPGGDSTEIGENGEIKTESIISSNLKKKN